MPKTILVGLDDSNNSQRAIEFVQRFVDDDTVIALVHVIEWSRFSFSTVEENALRHKRREEELQRAHEVVLKPVAERLQSENIAVECHARHGQVAEVLNQLATQLDADMIVVGRRGQSALTRKLFGSTTASLVQIADKPVVVVP